MFTHEFIMTKFVPNPKVNDATFQLDFPEGTYVVDKITEVRYTVGAEERITRPKEDSQNYSNQLTDRQPPRTGGSNNVEDRNSEDASAIEDQAAQGEPGVISPASNGYDFWVGKLLIAGGIIVVLCGLVLWHRQRAIAEKSKHDA